MRIVSIHLFVAEMKKKKKKKREKQTWFHAELDRLSPETTGPEGSAGRQVYILRVTLSLEHVFNH